MARRNLGPADTGLAGHDGPCDNRIMDRTLGFIGIGLMGTPMSRRLLAAGFSVVVWNRSPEKCRPLEAVGAYAATSLAEVATRCDVVMLCLSDTAAVREVVDALGPHLRPGQLVVDFSSIDPAATRELAARLSERSVSFVDAPVSGGVVGAEKGTLAIMAGGDEAAVERARPLVAPLCQRFTRLGGVGAGQVAKVCNQMIVACNVVVLAEVVALAESAGVDAGELPKALMGGFADSIPFQLVVPRMSERRFEPVQWRVKTLLKDLDNACALAAGLDVEAPMSERAAELYRRHATAGYSDRDPSTLIDLYTEHP